MQNRTWILAADGNTARILKGVNFLKDEPQNPEQEVLQTETRRVQDIMTDKPGRSHASVGPGRSAMEYSSDPVRDEKQKFAGDVAQQLEAYAAENAFDSLVICAAPQTLGDLRKALSPQVKERTIAEIDRNYSTIPTDQLIGNVRSVVFS